jgi:structural maintenance of chromosome 4
MLLTSVVHLSGDLGSIDKQYDVAASTASAALDYIVVEDTPTAQRCVELLRSRGLGVATFLILDKQKHLERRAAEKLQPPEGIYLRTRFPVLRKTCRRVP